ncbi:MAG: hypothetical protein NVSMB51_04220 [Solirubrobacteraceae bacterium]
MRRAALISCFLLAGCGGATRPVAPPGAGVSAAKRSYLAHFARSCKGVEQRSAAGDGVIRALLSRISRGDQKAAGRLSRYLRGLAAGYRSGLAQVRRLGAPPGPGTGDAVAYFAAADRAAQALGAIADAIDGRRPAQISAATSRLGAETRAAALAGRAYGFPQCGVVGPSA